MPRRVLVTGGAGFVGANLVRRLLRQGHETHLLLHARQNRWRLSDVDEDIQIHESDLADVEGLVRITALARPEWIFHLAAHGAYSWQTDSARMTQANVTGTMNLVRACLSMGFDAFVNTGTSSEYGAKDHAAVETELLEPNSVYAVTKTAATLFCQHIARSQHAHIPTLRLYSVYGPFEDWRRLMPKIVVSGLDGTLPPLASPGAAHDFVYVEDVLDAYLLAASVPNQDHGAIYNVGTGQQSTLRDVVEFARRVLGIKEQPRWISKAEGFRDTSIWLSDSRKIRRVLDWTPRYTLDQGFLKLVEWVRANPALWSADTEYSARV